MKAAVYLAALGTLMARRGYELTEVAAMTAELREDLNRTRAVVAALGQCAHDLTRASLGGHEGLRELLGTLRCSGTYSTVSGDR